MPLNNTANTIPEYILPICETGKEPSALTSIYQNNVNMAIWQRQHQQALDNYAAEWNKHYSARSIQLLLSVDKIAQQLNSLLPALKHKELFQQDIALLVDMFACLFDATEVGLRLTPLAKAMCPKFHVDNIPCRLVTTYGGLGTEWLLEENINRNYLGKAANGLPDHESGVVQGDNVIQQVSSQHIALLKGSGWLGSEKHGLVHRSPRLPENQTRLLLTLDFA